MFSQMNIEVELITVELMNPHDETQLELLLYTDPGLQSAHWYAAGDPKFVEVIPHGRAQVELHWLMVPFNQYILAVQLFKQKILPA